MKNKRKCDGEGFQILTLENDFQLVVLLGRFITRDLACSSVYPRGSLICKVY